MLSAVERNAVRKNKTNSCWYRITVLSFEFKSLRKNCDGEDLPKIIEFRTVSVFEAAHIFNVDVSSLDSKGFGCIYNQPLHNDTTWARLSKYPDYLKSIDK